MAAIPEKMKQTKAEPEKESDLYRAMMESRPQYKSNKEAAAAFTVRLELLAKKLNLSVPELLNEAETSREFKEEYLEAITLSRQIYLFNK